MASTIFSLIALAMGVIVLGLELFAGPLSRLLGDFEDPALQEVLARSLRIIAPVVIFFGLSGGVTGLLYALRRFTYTAFSGAVFNLGIVVAAPLLANRIGIYALPLGIVGGGLIQLAVLAPGLRGMRVRFSGSVESPGRAAHLAALRADRTGSHRDASADYHGWPLGVGDRRK